MSVYEIDPKLIKAAILFTSTEQTRYYLRGVYFEKRFDTLRMVATDGHRLFAAIQEIEPHDPDFHCILPSHDLKKAYTGVNSKVATIPAEFHGYSKIGIDEEKSRACKTATINNVTCTAIDGTYPDFTRVLPSLEACTKAETSQFNAKYVGDLEKAARALGKKGADINIQHAGASPALVGFGGRQDVMALIMPMRNEINLGHGPASFILGAQNGKNQHHGENLKSQAA